MNKASNIQFLRPSPCLLLNTRRIIQSLLFAQFDYDLGQAILISNIHTHEMPILQLKLINNSFLQQEHDLCLMKQGPCLA